MVDQLFTRIGTSDSIETNSSSFMVEMQEVAYITSRVTSRWDEVRKWHLILHFSRYWMSAFRDVIMNFVCTVV